MHRILPPLLLLCAIAPAAAAQDSASIAPRVDSIFASMDRPDRPGCALGVYRDGRVAYARGYGMASLELGVPITPRTVFYMGSLSKQFTAMAVALLAREGKLSLDDDVKKWVPELPDFGERITIRHLVHHTSGLREKWDLAQLAGMRPGDVVTQQDVLEMVSRQRALNFPPGSEHLYNNTAYDLLSVIAERAGGKPLRELARERMFAPLGMANTRYVDDRSLVVPNRAQGHAPRQGGGWRLDMTSNVETTGSGGVYSTIEDVARWDESFYSGRLGGPELVTLATTPGTLRDGRPLQYAFGNFVDEYRGLARVRHGGALGGYRTALLRFPTQRFSVAVLCNHSNVAPEALATRVTNVLLADRLGPVASERTVSGASAVSAASAGVSAPSAADASRLAGVYWDPVREEFVRVRADSGRVVLERASARLPLVARGEGRYGAGDLSLRFEAAAAGRPARLVVDERSYERVGLASEIAAPLADYAGSYRSDELQTTWRATVRGDTLLLRGAREAELRLRPLFHDTFVASNGTTVRFVREGPTVRAMVLTPGRSRRIRFERVD